MRSRKAEMLTNCVGFFLWGHAAAAPLTKPRRVRTNEESTGGGLTRRPWRSGAGFIAMRFREDDGKPFLTMNRTVVNKESDKSNYTKQNQPEDDCEGPEKPRS